MKRMELDRKHQKWRKEARYRSSFNLSAQAEMAGHLVSGKLHDAIGWAVEGRTCSFHIMKYHKYINNVHNCPQSTYPFGTSSAKIRARWRRNSTTGAFLIWAQSIFGLNTRNKQLDYRVTEGEKFHDGWDLIWYALIIIAHHSKQDWQCHTCYAAARLRCILTWNQDRLQLPIPCSIGSQGEFGWRSNEEQPRLSSFAPTNCHYFAFARMCFCQELLA